MFEYFSLINVSYYLGLVLEDTVHKGNNRPLFGIQDSLTFDISIAPYTITLFLSYFL